MQPPALRLSHITISNLRSIQNETFPLSSFTALIGYNNAGKTNILMGIRWLLANFSLDISYFDDPNRAVEVEGYFDGITDQILNRLGEEKAQEVRPFISGYAMRIKKVQRIPGEIPENIELWAYVPSNKRGSGKNTRSFMPLIYIKKEPSRAPFLKIRTFNYSSVVLRSWEPYSS